MSAAIRLKSPSHATPMLAFDAHTVTHLHHAGLLIGNSIDDHQAVEAHTHHAERCAWLLFDRSGAGIADIFRQHSSGNALSLGNNNAAAVDDNGDGLQGGFIESFEHR